MKTKKILVLLVLAVLMGLGATGAPAWAFFTNFDNPKPGPGPLVLPGVTFTPSLAGGGGTDPNAPSPPYYYYAFVNPLAGTNTYTMLTITFDQPVFLVKFQMNSNTVDNLSVNALDSNGNLLDSQGFNKYNTSISQYNPVVLCARGIKSLVISATATIVFTGGGISVQVGIDNFSFYPLAPNAAIIPLF